MARTNRRKTRKLDEIEQVNEMAEVIRQEPYRLFSNDCIRKSFRLKKACLAVDIQTRVAVCLGLAKALILGRWITVPVIHSWIEIKEERIETSRPLNTPGTLGIIPEAITPVIVKRF